uniref:Uncharacterized protein n=1 Tax=Anguilla anguilla TaxID=7936 RepID=A0A0E9RYX9_ANGAN
MPVGVLTISMVPSASTTVGQLSIQEALGTLCLNLRSGKM